MLSGPVPNSLVLLQASQASFARCRFQVFAGIVQNCLFVYVPRVSVRKGRGAAELSEEIRQNVQGESPAECFQTFGDFVPGRAGRMSRNTV